MNKCIICNASTSNLITIKFIDLVGLCESFNQGVKCCENCGHVFSNSIPSDIMTRYYKSLERSHYKDYYNQGTVGQDKVKMTKRQLSFITDKVTNFKNVFDIGALTGFNLNAFKNSGFDVYGVEPSSDNTTFAMETYGVKLFSGTLEEYYAQNKNKDKFDLIMLSHVLEHIADPVQFMQKVSDLNHKYIYLEVPAAIDYQLNNEPFGIFYYEHVNFFSISSINFLMNKFGYECIRGGVELNIDNTAPGEPALVSLWEKKPEKNTNRVINGVHRPSFLLEEYCRVSNQRMIRIKSIINEISIQTKLAIWGAGSHTSRLLGMTNLADKNIIKIYDADEQKQKHRLLKKEITPFNPNDIREGIVDKILISTYSGERSIMQYLRSVNLIDRAILLYN